MQVITHIDAWVINILLEKIELHFSHCQIRNYVASIYLGTTSLLVEAPCLVATTSIQRLWNLSHGKHSRLALTLSMQLLVSKHKQCWHAQMSTWLGLTCWT